MSIAITGATGFVGSALLDLAGPAEGDRGSDQPAFKALTRREQNAREGVEWVGGDLHDRTALERLARGAEAMVHIAGLTNTPDPANFEAANVAGTANVIAACKEAGVRRLVFVSSLAAREPQLSAYGASKAKAEKLVEASGLDWTIVRPPAVYGPRDRDMFELFRSAKWGLVPLPPGGAVSIIHVDDLVKLLLALATRAVRHKTYEPDDGREGGWSHKELAAAIARAVGRRSVIAPHLPRALLGLAVSGDRLIRGKKARLTADRVGYMCHPNWVARFDRAVPSEIWKAAIGGEEGLVATARWYREAGWL